MNFLETKKEHENKAIQVLKKLDLDKKFSDFARDKFNEVGLSGKASKAEEMLDELHEIAVGKKEIIDPETGEKKIVKSKTENRIKAIRVAAEMMGGGLNEKQTQNIQNNQFNFGDFLNKIKE